MDELEVGLQISVTGPLHDEAIAACAEQLRVWDLAMPQVQPLVLDFGLGDFEHVGHVECWLANEAQAGYCGKYIFVADGQTCPMHRHEQKHETFYILKGCVRMVCDGQERKMVEGETLSVAPGKPHSFSGIGPALLLELSMPSVIKDNYFENTAIPIGGNYKQETAT